MHTHLQTKLIEYTDNDALHKPATRGVQVYAVEGALISKAAITEKYATMFGDGIGQLEGEYRIRLDDAVDSIQHVECGSSVVECRTRSQVSPGSNPALLPCRRLGIFVLSI